MPLAQDNNPDLDLLPPPPRYAGAYPPFQNPAAIDHYGRGGQELSYGSFASGPSTPGGNLSDYYPVEPKMTNGGLETVREEETGHLLAGFSRDRPGSRSSTHV